MNEPQGLFSLLIIICPIADYYNSVHSPSSTKQKSNHFLCQKRPVFLVENSTSLFLLKRIHYEEGALQTWPILSSGRLTQSLRFRSGSYCTRVIIESLCKECQQDYFDSHGLWSDAINVLMLPNNYDVHEYTGIWTYVASIPMVFVFSKNMTCSAQKYSDVNSKTQHKFQLNLLTFFAILLYTVTRAASN